MPGRVPTPFELGRRPRVGVLALQGDFARHQSAFDAVGARTRLVRNREDFDDIDALAIPGGESTTLLRLLEVGGIRERLTLFARTQPVLGTCAGLILLAHRLADSGGTPAPPLDILDVDVERNAYGRQIDSFESPVTLDALGGREFDGVFIRAPKIRRVGHGVEVVASRDGEPVGVRQGHTLGLCFHPELSSDRSLHRFFLAACCGQPVD